MEAPASDARIGCHTVLTGGAHHEVAINRHSSNACVPREQTPKWPALDIAAGAGFACERKAALQLSPCPCRRLLRLSPLLGPSDPPVAVDALVTRRPTLLPSRPFGGLLYLTNGPSRTVVPKAVRLQAAPQQPPIPVSTLQLTTWSATPVAGHQEPLLFAPSMANPHRVPAVRRSR